LVVPGIGTIHGFCQQPGECNLCRGRAFALRDALGQAEAPCCIAAARTFPPERTEPSMEFEFRRGSGSTRPALQLAGDQARAEHEQVDRREFCAKDERLRGSRPIPQVGHLNVD
jgi:hypothetical protein